MITKIVNIIPGLRSRVSHFRITVLYSLDPGYQSVLTPPPPTAPIDPQCIDFTVDCYYSQVSSIISLSWHSMSGPGYCYESRWLHHSPQEAGESGDGGVHGDAHVSHRQAEHQEIAGGPELSHLEESDDRQRV